MVKRIAVLVLSLAGFASYGECSKHPKESTLSFPQVMYHLGRAPRIGGAVAMRGASDPSAVRAEDIIEAIQVIDVAVECANLSNHDTTGELLPQKVSKLNPADRAAYMQKYTDHMNAYVAKLLEFRSLFCALQLTTPSEDLFYEIQDKEAEVMDVANRSHADFGKP